MSRNSTIDIDALDRNSVKLKLVEEPVERSFIPPLPQNIRNARTTEIINARVECFEIVSALFIPNNSKNITIRNREKPTTIKDATICSIIFGIIDPADITITRKPEEIEIIALAEYDSGIFIFVKTP